MYELSVSLETPTPLCFCPQQPVRRPLVLGLADGRWKPTITHHFISMCHEHGILLGLFTQNIDGLDYVVRRGGMDW